MNLSGLTKRPKPYHLEQIKDVNSEKVDLTAVQFQLIQMRISFCRGKHNFI